MASGEQVSAALLALALRDLGLEAVSLLGHQVRISTDSAFGRARIRSIDRHRLLAALDQGSIAVVAGFQGVDSDDNITTLGRGGIGHHRRGAGGRAVGRRLRDLHRRGRGLHDRSAHRAGRTQARADLLRRDARAREPRRQGPADPLRGVRQALPRAGPRALELRRLRRHDGRGGGQRNGRRHGVGSRPRQQPDQAHAAARPRSPGPRRAGLRSDRRRGYRRRHDHPERLRPTAPRT